MRRGNIHKYLGMNLYYTVIGTPRISMLKYSDDILNEFDKTDPSKSGTKSSDVPKNLFKVYMDCEKLSPDKVKGLHNLVDKTLYTIRRSRHDNCTSVAFLNTRVRETDTDNWK